MTGKDLFIVALPYIKTIFLVLRIWWVVMGRIRFVCVDSLRGLMRIGLVLFIILV